MAYLKGVTEKINSARDKVKELENATIEGKKAIDYDYYKAVEG